MRFRVFVYSLNAAGAFTFVQMGTGANTFSGALLDEIRDAMQSSAIGVYVADTTGFQIWRLR